MNKKVGAIRENRTPDLQVTNLILWILWFVITCLKMLIFNGFIQCSCYEIF